MHADSCTLTGTQAGADIDQGHAVLLERAAAATTTIAATQTTHQMRTQITHSM
jgi:hypothetical protein